MATVGQHTDAGIAAPDQLAAHQIMYVELTFGNLVELGATQAWQ
jgi:hypothetical protein